MTVGELLEIKKRNDLALTNPDDLAAQRASARDVAVLMDWSAELEDALMEAKGNAGVCGSTAEETVE